MTEEINKNITNINSIGGGTGFSAKILTAIMSSDDKLPMPWITCLCSFIIQLLASRSHLLMRKYRRKHSVEIYLYWFEIHQDKEKSRGSFFISTTVRFTEPKIASRYS